MSQSVSQAGPPLIEADAISGVHITSAPSVWMVPVPLGGGRHPSAETGANSRDTDCGL